MTTNPHGLPVLLAEFSQIIGLKKTLELAMARGGVRVYIPKCPKGNRDQDLVNCIGLESAQMLADIYGGDKYLIPQAGLRSKATRILRARGSRRQVAQAVGCDERYVRMVENAPDKNPDQDDLFDED